MDKLTRDELETLAAREGTACVSLYMPLHRTYPQLGDDPPYLAELLDESERVLCEQEGLEEGAAKQLLQSARALIEDRDFWQASDADGLAVLLASPQEPAPSFLTYRLPYPVTASVDVGKRFHLTPLVRLLDSNTEFQLLALGLDSVRLYRCDRVSMEAVALPGGVPASFEQYTAGTEVGRPIQFRASTAGGAGGDQVGLVHGQTSYKDDHKMRVKEFVSQIGKEFQNVLKSKPMPLIVAAVDYLQPPFREACPSEWLIPQGVHGSPDELSEQELHQQAIPLIVAWQDRSLAEFGGKYHTRLAHGHASPQLEVIIPAAEQGRVDSLLIGSGLRVWGDWDARNHVVTRHDQQESGDIDLLDLAVRETLSHGGEVHAVDPRHVPDGAVAAAVLRW